MTNFDDMPAPGVRIDARIVPFPASISPQARAALAAAVGPDGRVKPRPTFPPADDHDAWVKARAEQAKLFLANVPSSSATVETETIAGVTVHVGRPAGIGADVGNRAYIDIHGGALVYGGGAPARAAAQMAAERHGVPCYGIDYRMPPECPYPAPLDDCLSVYRAILERCLARNVIVGGVSAGGNLAAALMLRARDEGLPAPAALVLLTPEVDLTESGDSFEVHRLVDVILQDSLADSIALYAGDHPLDDPYLSPLFGDFTRGFPPTFVQAGSRDLFLSNAVRIHRALRRAKVPVELHVFEGMPHGGFRGAPEDAELAAEVDRFVAAHWGNETEWH